MVIVSIAKIRTRLEPDYSNNLFLSNKALFKLKNQKSKSDKTFSTLCQTVLSLTTT